MANSAYVTAKHGLVGLCKTVAKEGGKFKIRADVISKVMLKETVDGEFTTVQDVAEVAWLFAGFETNALTGQSLVMSHGWFMQ